MTRATQTVGAVVVTYRRPSVLKQTLDAIRAQDIVPQLVVVVDNGASSGTDQVSEIVASYPRLFEYLPAANNLGYGAGLKAGMEYLKHILNPDYYWLMDDDSPPEPTSLATKLGHFRVGDAGIGVVAGRGGHVRCGRIRHDLRHVSGRAEEADFTAIDGALVAAGAVQESGFPRTDLFMMLEDFEYTSRLAASGFRLLVHGDDQTRPLHLGSSAPWRGYYQARNLIRIALDRRSVPLLFGWFSREVGFALHLICRRKWEELSLRCRGSTDGLRGKMGRTMNPT